MEGANKVQDTKVQVKTIVLPIGSTASFRSSEVTLESEYKTCIGYYVIRNTGSDYLKLGIKDASGKSIAEPCNLKHFEVSTDVAIKDRFFKETPFEANGKIIKVSVENFATTTVQQEIEVLFLLAK